MGGGGGGGGRLIVKSAQGRAPAFFQARSRPAAGVGGDGMGRDGGGEGGGGGGGGRAEATRNERCGGDQSKWVKRNDDTQERAR